MRCEILGPQFSHRGMRSGIVVAFTTGIRSHALKKKILRKPGLKTLRNEFIWAGQGGL